MHYAMFHCCVTASHLPDFDASAEALLAGLSIEAREVPEFGCCGYPLKNVDLYASLAASARNLALAEREGLAILTTCACCSGTLRHAAWLLRDEALRGRVNDSLASEGLIYQGTAVVRHLFELLKDEVHIERIRPMVKSSPFARVALQYGCKLLRPSMAGHLNPSGQEPFFEQLAEAVGAEPAHWGLEKDCCGSGICTTDTTLATAVSRAKLESARKAGAQAVVVACPFCMLQLGNAQKHEDGMQVVSGAAMLCSALGLRAECPG